MTMNTSRAKQAAIERRCLLLKEVWEEHQKHNAIFLRDLCIKHKIGLNAITVMKDMQVIKKSPKWGVGWYDWMVGEPNKALAENIHKKESEKYWSYPNRNKHLKDIKQQADVSQPVQDSSPVMPFSLKSLSDQDIISELRSRGYAGSLQLTVNI